MMSSSTTYYYIVVVTLSNEVDINAYLIFYTAFFSAGDSTLNLAAY